MSKMLLSGVVSDNWPEVIKLFSCSTQGLNRLEKYLNVQDCLGKSLKIKVALKST